MKVRIDQLVPSFALHDAIGNHVLEVRAALRAAGFASDIYGEHIDPRLAGECAPFAACPDRPDPGEERLLLYQSSTDSAAIVGWLEERAGEGQVVLSNYHNLTPASYFDRWSPEAAASMRAGREELARLAPITSLALTESEYNRLELVELGYPEAVVAPLLLDLSGLRATPDPATAATLARRRAEGSPQWLFVGRIAPNKCQHDVVAALAVAARLAPVPPHLTLVGSVSATRYDDRLRGLIRQLGVEDRVHLVRGAPLEVLVAHYAGSDVFVCQSEHEGFCVPIVEAMALGLPVVAHAAAAVPDTVGDAGVLLAGKDPLATAVAVDDLLSDRPRIEELRSAGLARVARWDRSVTAPRFVGAITDWLARR